jgi:chromosome segregation protein
MIRISSIEICGFRGIRDLLRVNFSAGFTVITGPNGSGKSSILDAIEFALSGKLSKYEEGSGEKGEKASDYEWWRGKKPAIDRFVRLELIDEEGNRTSVTRRPEGVQVQGNVPILDLLCDTTLNPESSIEELCRTSIIRDEFIARNSVDLPETERFSFVRAAVGSHSTSEMDEKLLEAAKIIKKRSDEAQREYEGIRLQVQDSVERLSAARGQAAQQIVAKDAEQYLRQAMGMPTSDYEQLIGESDKEIRRLRTQTDLLRSLVSRALIASERKRALEEAGVVSRKVSLELEVKDLIAAHAKSDKELKESRRVLQAIQASQDFMANMAQIHGSGSKIGLRSERCPLCGSQVDEVTFRKHLEEIGTEISNHGSQIALAMERQGELRTIEQNTRNELDTLQASYDRVEAEINTVQKQWDAFQSEVAKVNPAYADFSTGRLQGELENLTERLSGIEQHRRALGNSDLIQRIVDLERDLEETQNVALQAEKQATKLRRVEDHVKEATATLKRIGYEAVEERLAAIKPLFTELYLRLRPHIDWKTVTYAIRGDVRKFLSLRVEDGLNLKFLFSSGQRRATGLAFLISVALSRPWCRFKTIVLDDPVQHVDDFRAVHLVETLAAIRTMNYQLLCAVEDSALADLLSRRLRSSYKEGGTLIRMKYVSGEGAQIEDIRDIVPFERVILSVAS